MRRTNRVLTGGIAAGARVRRRVLEALLYILFAVGFLGSAQPVPGPSQARKTDLAPASAVTPVLDGRWWRAISGGERLGYVNGYEDCYVYDAKGAHTATGWTANRYVGAVEEHYRQHPDQRTTPVSSVLKEINRTGRARPVPAGGEEWKENHGYYDGLWWRGASAPEQLGFVEGYLSCYSTEMPGAPATFSKAANEYVRLMNSYMQEHVHSDEEKVADMLGRFRDHHAQQ